MSRQRSRRVVASSIAWPLKTTRPPACRPFSASTPMMARTAVVLPQPDSPTRPTMRPSGTTKEAPSTARAMPSRVL